MKNSNFWPDCLEL